MPDEPAFGVYLHVPFCRRRCDYCAFATWTDRHHLAEAYVDACIQDLAGARADGRRPPVPATSVFVGGGTPSQLPGPLLARFLSVVDHTPDAEVTVECNPDDATGELFDAWLTAGVNRVSFGVQSMASHVLGALGREHSPAAVRRAVDLARSAGFVSWNVDLIYGAAGESVDDWRATLDAALELEPPHVSAYALTVEPGTPLARDASRHPDDDDQATKYALAEERLSAAGLAWYELSNWARPTHECRHNLLYWSGGEYLGVGCAAHSHAAGVRWWNVRTPERYISLVSSGASPVGGEERLGAEERALEAAQLALRTRAGVPAEWVPPFADEPELARLVEIVEPVASGGSPRAVLTVPGRLLANEVALRLRRPSTAADRGAAPRDAAPVLG